MNAQTVKGIIRHALGFAAGWLASKGIELDGASIELISGGIGALVAVAWSVKDKKPAAPKPLDS